MQTEKVLLEATLCFPISEYKVLLAQKTRGIGRGKLNGFGGGLEKDESLLDCCSRETLEESGLLIDKKDFVKVGIVYFHNTKSNGQVFVCKVYVFITTKWTGLPKDGDGMVDPKWYPIYGLPFGQMLPADRFWLSQIILSGKKIIAEVHYGPFQKELLRSVEIREVLSFSDDD